MTTRRNFIKTTAAGAAGIAIVGQAAGSVLSAPKPARPIHVFTKCLQFLNYDEMAEVLARNGFDGADLTVRPGGQVLPENVKKDLPKAYSALRKAGIGTDMIVTKISDPDHPDTKPILKTMADIGIRFYRMGYMNYDNKKTMPQNLDTLKRTMKKLEKLNRTYGVTAEYQNHSGSRVGGPVWDLYHLLQDCDPKYMGVQYDVRHGTVEGGMSWPLGMKLVAPWIHTTDIKDFIWNKNEKGQWKVKNVPLGEGMVDFKKYFELYKALKIKGPVSIHYEYDLGGAEHGKKEITMSLAEIEKYLQNDLKFLKDNFEKYGL
ncbi:MAG: TIM barrel protein [Draconibacterium sp.]|nr:TIM barrel protein [Draconibacterium sp.]